MRLAAGLKAGRYGRWLRLDVAAVTCGSWAVGFGLWAEPEAEAH